VTTRRSIVFSSSRTYIPHILVNWFEDFFRVEKKARQGR
jgi:hypothetical protein